MARLAPVTLPTEQSWFADDPLSGDRIDFDAWLLPSEVPNRTERAIRTCSIIAGPVAFVAALACVLGWIA